MKNKFYCQKCKSIFEAEGKKIEYQDPIYEHCCRRVANCPTCNAECSEYTQKSSSKKGLISISYVNDLRNRGGGGCNPGGGCCG